MAQSGNSNFSKSEMVFFENVLEKFDPTNTTARNVSTYSPPMQMFERSGLTVSRPMPYISTVVDGLDVGGQYKNLTQLSVPSTLSQSDIKSVPFTLNALELNDPTQRTRKAESCVQALSARVDRDTARVVSNQGSLVVSRSSALSGYADVAAAESLMLSQEIPIEQQRALIFNAFDGANVAENLAERNDLSGQKSLSAYERSRIGMVAGFETLKTSFLPRLAAAAGAAVTVDGAQRYVPLATDANGNNVDNRYMNLTVNSTTGKKVGDAFTIDGVNALSHIGKEDTGQLKTFRITEVVDGTTLKITPAIVVGDGTSDAEDEYANVTAAAADTASLTFLNTTATNTNVFMMQNAVEIIHGKLAVDNLGPGISVMREATDSGIEIIFARQGEIDDLSARYRLTMWTRSNVLNTEMCGILIGGQS